MPLPSIYTRIGLISAVVVEWRGRLEDDALADEDSGLDEGNCGDGGVDDGVDVQRIQDRQSDGEEREKMKIRGLWFLLSFYRGR